MTVNNIGIKHNNFEVRQHNFPKAYLAQLFPNTHAEALKILGASYKGGRKHHRKHSTRRRKSTKRRFKRTKISTIM